VKIVGVIPARYGSTRFPGKPLKKILQRPLLEWVIEGSRRSRLLSEVWVATDHPEIRDLAAAAGVRAVMTSPDLPTGSDRVYAAVKDENVDVVVNIQGDEPLITGECLDQLISPMREDSNLQMATLGREITEEDLASVNTAKIVLNHRSEALYFSRFAIPYSRVQSRIDAVGRGAVCLKHIGLYAYRKTFLAEFCSQPPTPLELAEGLEQLRALYLGARIRVVKVDHDSWGVDTPEDIAKVEGLLKARSS